MADLQHKQEPQKISCLKSLKNQPHQKNKNGNVPWNHQKLLSFQIPGSKTVKKVKIDPQQRRYGRKSYTSREWVCDIYIIIDKLSL